MNYPKVKVLGLDVRLNSTKFERNLVAQFSEIERNVFLTLFFYQKQISYIRDTMSCMKPEYQHLSPAIGAALCNSVVLPNLFSAVGGVQKYNTSITYPSNTYSPIQNAILAREMVRRVRNNFRSVSSVGRETRLSFQLF